MVIEVSGLSKRYGYQWIIRNVHYRFCENTRYGISGRNGSGKSTVIKLLSGYLTPSAGFVYYQDGQYLVPPSQQHEYFSWVAPYTDLIQEFTMKEMFLFHTSFKKSKFPVSWDDFLNIMEWKDTGSKEIRFFSSGMKQKLQLALAILSDTPVLLLDEPSSYLDEAAKKWFSILLSKHTENRIVIISSNDAFDINLCDKVIDVSDWNGN